MSLLLPWVAVIGGFAGLIWGADRFVNGGAAIATNFGVSKFIIGLTIVAFGTSAPEVVVSISSSVKGIGEIAIGNALGSNLANIGLVLGITALLAPLPIHSRIIKQETPIMLGIMGIAGFFFWDNQFMRWEGIALVCLMIPLIFWLIYSQKEAPEELDELESMKTWIAIVWFLVGLIIVICGAELLVWGASDIALALGISPLVIGLTVVAIGTSLPELAASVISALKGHHDIAIGNVIGSNIFNLLLVAGIPAIIEPLTLAPEVFSRDYLSMIVLSLILCGGMIISAYLTKKMSIGRLTGVIFLLFYGGYYWLLFAK